MVDLRRPEERAREPNRWPDDPARVVFNDEGAAIGLPPHLQALLRDDLTSEGVAAYMRSIYREFAFDPRHIQLYRAWFQKLNESGGPAIIHCAAGKDRTGLGCALTLVALGVDEESIFADYEFTNQAIDLDARLPRIQARMEERLERKLNAEALRPMLGVHADYLRGALDEIDARYGSALGYLECELGVGPEQRSKLREHLAE
jgi:protein tyrosine/serine phosphatase